MAEDLELGDNRLVFIADYTLKTLKQKPDKWKKFYDIEDHKTIINTFLDTADEDFLIIYLNAAGALSVLNNFPLTLKMKGCYFIKKNKSAIGKDEPMKDTLSFGDLSNIPLEQLASLVDDVYVPLLSNVANHGGWPSVVSQDVLRHVHSIRSNVSVVKGQVKGKTILSLPSGAENVNEEHSKAKKGYKINQTLIHSLESAVIDWTQQVEEVLKKDSSSIIMKLTDITPIFEINFWKMKLKNLDCIYEQLRSEKISKIAYLLEKSNSGYYPSFHQMVQDVTLALKEAQDCDLFLKPLATLIEDIEMKDFTEVKQFNDPLFHYLALIWAESEYYNSPKRLILLLQQFCNLMIKQATSYMDTIELFKGEIDEGLERTRFVYEFCDAYQNSYEKHKNKIHEYFKDKEVRHWELAPELIFGRWNGFVHRVELMKDLMETAAEFNRLEKVELAGLSGRHLSSKIIEIYEQFKNEFEKFGNKTYEPIDPMCQEFIEDYDKFRQYTFDLDRRLCAIICQGFDDCNGPEAVYKFLHVFGNIVERPLIQKEFEAKYPIILTMIDKNIDDVKKIYEEQMEREKIMGKIDLHRAMPKVAGSLRWASELKERLVSAKTGFEAIHHPVTESEEATRVMGKHEATMKLLEEFEQQVFKEWQETVDEASKFNMHQNIIKRVEIIRIASNFDPQLKSVLQEVKYMEVADITDIPEKAAEIYKSKDKYRNLLNHLDYAVKSYNRIKDEILEVEYPLLNLQIQTIDEVIKRGEKDLMWDSDGLEDYVIELRTQTHDLEERLLNTKSNTEEIKKIMSTWTKTPLFERHEAKNNTLLMTEDKEERLHKRFKEIEEAGTKIHGLLKQNQELFKVTDVSSLEWRKYVEYVDEMVVDGCFDIVQCSFRFFDQQTNPANNPDPLFEAQMILTGGDQKDTAFNPSLEDNAPDGFYDQVDGLLGNVCKQASLIPRLAKHLDLKHYQDNVENTADLNDLRTSFMAQVNEVMQKAEDYRHGFEQYAYLWENSQVQYMKEFLIYNHPLSNEEHEKLLIAGQGATDEKGIPKCPPTLAQFKEQIDSFEKKYEDVENLQHIQIFDNWFRVDLRPFKNSLLTIIKKWSDMFKQHLIDHVTNSLKELEDFITRVDTGLSKKLKDGDYDGLVECMDHLGKVKERQNTTDEMFEPLKETIELLKTYGQELPDQVHLQLQDLPEQWNNTKKNAITVKQQVAPLQGKQVNKIRNDITLFDLEQNNYRERFRATAPFNYESENPYKKLDKCNADLTEMEEKMRDINSSAKLFEVTLSEFKQIRMCRKEIKMIKNLWDYINVILTTFKNWNKTKWKDINVDIMDTETKKFAKDIRGLDKEVRAWNAFSGLETAVKNMITSLQAVKELQSNAIRDRHWQQIMVATGVKFEMNDDTTLEDLLSLNLHQYEEEVKTIVDKANKESSMEKMLTELDTIWADMDFLTEVHTRSKTTLLVTSDELIEKLEDFQNQLQNMITNKYISYFFKEVSSWQKKLSQADQVISILLDVQRTWSHLESIFIGTEDIRKQLPEDSARFDQMDKRFKEIAEVNASDLNVVRCTNRDHLYEDLEEVQKQLALCEKALAEYLETKRLAFPRFYFISSTDLLDILSNGNQPEIVMKHLTKLFDSMSKLKIPMDKEGNVTEKTSSGMWAKDGEYLEFPSKCDLSGQVEIWLNRLLDKQRETVHYHLSEAVNSYEEKPREQWIFDYNAQSALTGSQIWWTTEVNIAFQKLEEAYENALKDYFKKQVSQLNTLIQLLIGDLNKGDRQKIMTICTIDVHARDVVGKMIANKVETAGEFMWQCQMRHRWDDQIKDCFANICDAQFRYWHEYLGNQPRLVITPLTDRCYITLTQSLHLCMGGAPAGPAGTGKTETTKDLGRSLGMMVYVFNCSEQMDYKSCGNIYKGLAQSGAWGCFDEFNRISVEVLSVVAVQVKSIQDAIKDKKKRFMFMGEDIVMIPTVGLFITMNPGYAGRTELPENLKALFRPCAMVVPDFDLICEIMLVAEGFLEARLLARKFITLYSLCKELLSKQDHYDWGLRAIKSVLVVAGTLKRDDKQRPEDQVLMRALRDFNVPKIVTDDLPIFMGLIGDLFPALDVPRKRDLDFEKKVKQAAVDLHLQPEDSFILKVVQLQELFAVRHSVFIIGLTGTGKTQVWKTLHKTYQNDKMKPIAIDLNPKAVTNDELFGIINPSTREWKDGLFSVIMRDLAVLTSDGWKWIVLDGDIDPMWIESLNTVMDDNKILTLASNERIPLTPSMRLLFEISHLKTATPATVSRAGILYINPADLGWNPPVTSWIDTREMQTERANLSILFEKYVPPLLEAFKIRFKKITPIVEGAHLSMLCSLLECLLIPPNISPDSSKDVYEQFFVFATIWAFGGCLFQDQLADHRIEFSKWWTTEFKTVKFPTQGTVFDYYIDSETKKFEPWTKIVQSFELDPDVPLQATLVNTTETTRIRFFMDLLVEKNRPMMLVGNAGLGKTVLVKDKLNQLNPESWTVVNVPFNFYTTSEMLQKILEKPLEKKAGKNYGPPGSKRLIYFIDDMNMPEVDKYFTVQPHTLLRQHLDYSHWYDRTKLSVKEIKNCQYISCMNPTAGSFTINTRLQRHFSVFAISFPGVDALSNIYSQILSQHFGDPGVLPPFSTVVQRSAQSVISTALALHSRINSSFLPTATKFHYVFNLRDLSNIFQGMLFSTGDCLRNQNDVVKLFMHEAERVYCDKLVDEEDISSFEKILRDTVKKHFEDINSEEVFAKPNIFCHFAQGLGDVKYAFTGDWESLKKILTDSLSQYNEINSVMNLVLFEDAMAHICRINRILESPRGNALLVGVGGSGKQSLSRLAAFISNLEIFQIQLRKGYGIPDLKLDLNLLYKKAGIKNLGTVFLMTDAQVADESFLVLINDLLASGEVPDLFPDDEFEEIISSLRPEVKNAGMEDSKENCWKFFIERVQRTLKVVLCFSPVGATLRVRSRKFPALTNCTSIDWFHEWPESALESVGQRFIAPAEELPEEMKESVAKFMAYVHKSVGDVSSQLLSVEKRYNYTTPKSFLEQITLYRNTLTQKYEDLQKQIQRLINGLEKLNSTTQQVDDLKDKLKSQEVIVKSKNEAADKLIKVVSEEEKKVRKEKHIADEEAEKVMEIEKVVTKQQIECSKDLEKAMPALKAAEEALNTLNKNNLTEMKAFANPPPAVVTVMIAVRLLRADEKGGVKDKSWKASKAAIPNAEQFLNSLINFDKEHIPEKNIKAVEPIVLTKDFDPEIVRTKSFAAGGLCSWAINIYKFHQVYKEVHPKQMALEKANLDLTTARDKLSSINSKVKDLEGKLDKLTQEYNAAMAEKQRCQDEADKTFKTIELANRLVGGLASENIRWTESVKNLRESETTIPGDVLLTTAFLSYVGSFPKIYRTDLIENLWTPYLAQLPTPIKLSEGFDVVELLVDKAQIAIWNNEGLPSDRMSTENAMILTNCERWPLMIDPQLQGIKWIKSRYGDKLKVIRIGQRGYMEAIEYCVETGGTMLIEYIGETIEAVLDPLIGRNTVKKGKYIILGEKEIEYHSDFRLILQTKLANPHYKPEIQAQTTLLNFTVTKDGLEDQLLADVVASERPDLEKQKYDLTRSQNEYKITLKKLEDSLLARLSAAEGNFLGDYELVENLETTKRTAIDIEEKVQEAKITTLKIDEARELYRPAAARASVLYFIMNELHKINPMYQFSLKAFKIVFNKAIEKAEPSEDVKQRVINLIDTISYSTFIYTTRGLFEKDKLTFLAQMMFQVLLMNKEIDVKELDFLLRFPIVPNVTSPVDFLSNVSWGGIKALSSLEDFRHLDRDIEGSAKRWKKLVESEIPEKEKFPQDWKNKTGLQKLCMMRALRPDRMSYAVTNFIEEKLGHKYVEGRSVEFGRSFEETTPSTPMFFILSPGVDPLKDVEALGKKLGFTFDEENFHNVSLGQGQEVIAESALEQGAEKGHWVVLQNIHLVERWLPTLEKKLEHCSEIGSENFRVFISAEPAGEPSAHIIPQGILENAIKITNEPPTGMMANLHKSFDLFNQDTLEMCSKETEFKSILFSLCYFHAVVSERRKFGAQGWNRTYPFNNGDLTISVDVLYNYLEPNPKVPWDDLRYLFGEIMYGGHITDDWDRRLCRTYLQEYLNAEMFDGELMLAPNFPVPPNSDYVGYHNYIDEVLPAESPYLYGLHPNAEIDFLTTLSDNLFKTVFEMQPRDTGASGGQTSSNTREEKIRQILDEVYERLPEEFNMLELFAKTEEKTPYTVVAIQECERMNMLINEMRKSLNELNLGLKGELTITEDMELLSEALFLDKIPDNWIKKAYPSLYSLSTWYADFLIRVKELESWSNDFILPYAVWLGGLFNPQSFLTAIMQVTARKNEWPLDKMCLSVDVTKKTREDLASSPREGAYVHGLFMEGARWDTQTGQIGEARLKELTPMMPVLFIKAITTDRQETKNFYECPVYKTKQRGPTFVWTFNLKSKEKPAVWILGGVCLLLQV
ncbi:hypothetical protein SNEBB_008024 [Seison nebaliae]|nr:hypothetical protein SNEBB_008024 [Seison nebaliae]